MNSTSETGQSRYWVREHGVHVRSGPGLQQPILTQLARGQAVEATADPAILADGYHWLPIRQGDTTAFVARELLSPQAVRPDPVGPVPVAPELVTAAQGTPLAAHTRALMAIAICESGARTARDNGGELVHRFEPLQWDRLFRDSWGEPPTTWTPEKCYVTSWGVGQIMGWAHATFGCADALAFRTWLQEDPAHEYAALVGFCLAKPGVAEALQTESWEQLWRLYNGGHPQWLPHFQGALARVVEAAYVPEAPAPRAEMSAGPGVNTAPAARSLVAPLPDAAPAAADFSRIPPRAPAAPGRLTHQAVTVVRPALQGLRYEGSRLVRRGLMLVTLVFTLWQTNVISPAQIVDLLEEAVVPLVTDQTDSVEGRLGHSLDALEARLAALEQVTPPHMSLPSSGVAGAVMPAPNPTPVPTAAPPSAPPATPEPTAPPLPPPAPTPEPTPSLELTPTPLAAEVPTGPPAPAEACGPRQTVLTARYHVRAAPALDATVVAILGPGTPVCVLTQQAGWSRLQEPEGWIADAGLAPLPLAG